RLACIRVPYGGFLADYLIGPYCFYNDTHNGLALSYCNIPFCSASGTYDCVCVRAQLRRRRRRSSQQKRPHVLYDATYYDETGTNRVGSSGDQSQRPWHRQKHIIGTAELARQFGPSLDVSLIDCDSLRLAVQPANHFQEVLQPRGRSYGVVMFEPARTEEASLAVQLFTDADRFRRHRSRAGAKDASKGDLERAGRFKQSRQPVVIVPNGTFPWISQAFGVVKSQKSEFKGAISTGQPDYQSHRWSASKAAPPVTYVLDYWKPAGLPSNVTSSTKQKVTFQTSTQEDCLNEYVLPQIRPKTAPLSADFPTHS
uniref:RRM domain-containing protein n=1 Tax=Macrostomum lignano TaxID=282301 RepID=A0A1I8F7R0_9PLAT